LSMATGHLARYTRSEAKYIKRGEKHLKHKLSLRRFINTTKTSSNIGNNQSIANYFLKKLLKIKNTTLTRTIAGPEVIPKTLAIIVPATTERTPKIIDVI